MVFWMRKTDETKLPKFVEPDHESPEAFIRSFCQDYKSWNDHCVAVSAATDRSEDPKMMSRLQKIYDDFVAGYVVPNTRMQLISFGTDASFDPDRLTFGALKIEDTGLKQQFSIKSLQGDWSDDYFAHLHRSEDHGFRLEQIYYIDPFPEDYVESQGPFLPSL